MSKRTGLSIAIAFLLILAGLITYNTWIKSRHYIGARKAAWEDLKENIKTAKAGYNGDVSIVIKDLDMNWEIDYNKDMAIPSASLVKIPIMMAYFYAADEGKIKLDDKLELRQSEKVDGSGILKSESSGSAYTIEELIRLAITQSDNTAANMLIDAMGLDRLNRYFARLGLKATNLSRKMMDFRSRKAGVENYTTASDMAFSLERLYRGQILSRGSSKKCLELLSEQKIKDRIPKRLPINTAVAHKTGLENGICHDVGIVYTGKGNFLICVLTKHEYRLARPMKRLIARLSLLTYDYYNNF